MGLLNGLINVVIAAAIGPEEFFPEIVLSQPDINFFILPFVVCPYLEFFPVLFT